MATEATNMPSSLRITTSDFQQTFRFCTKVAKDFGSLRAYGILLGQVVHHEAPSIPFGRCSVDNGLEKTFDAFDVWFIFQGVQSRRKNLLSVVLESFLEQSILIAEFLVHARGIQSGSSDDIRHRAGFVAFLPEYIYGLYQDVVSIVVFVASHAGF